MTDEMTTPLRPMESTAQPPWPLFKFARAGMSMSLTIGSLLFWLSFTWPVMARTAANYATAGLSEGAATVADTTASGPLVCKSGIYIKTIRIHEAEEMFEVLFYWWVRVDSADLDEDHSHMADIEFINAEAEVEVDYDSLDLATRSHLVMGRCKANIPYKAYFERFPYDVQSLVIAMENKVANAADLVYVPDELSLPINAVEHRNIEMLNGNQFTIRALEARAATYTYETNFGDPTVEGFEPYSRMEFVIRIDRDPAGLMQKVALPLFVVLFLAYLVFFIPDFEIGTASALTVTALLAAIAFQWTLNDALPKVSYLTLVDKVFYLVYLYIFYAMAQTVFTFNLNKRGEALEEEDPKRAMRLQALSERIEWHSRYLFPGSFLLFLWILVQ